MNTRTKDKIAHWVARHLPKRIVMWAFIVVTSHATTGEYDKTIVPNLSAMEALDRYSRDFKLYESEIFNFKGEQK